MPIPVSTLQRNAASVIRRVAASGVSEEITDRGRVVAVLSPPPTGNRLERLRQAGVTRAADPTALAAVLAADLPEVGLAAALGEQRDTDR